jgi:hypothetical protein
MVSDLDIWRAVNLLIRRHGADAEIQAARLQDLMLVRRVISWVNDPLDPEKENETSTNRRLPMWQNPLRDHQSTPVGLHVSLHRLPAPNE